MAGEIKQIRKQNPEKKPAGKSRRKRMTYRQKIAVGRPFKLRLLKIFLAMVLICTLSLIYLWFWLDHYETYSQNGAMRSYMERVAAHDWDSIYAEDTENFVEFNSKETIISYLIYLYNDKHTSGITFAYTEGGDNWANYDCYYRQEKISVLELVRADSNAVWKVRTANVRRTYSFDVIDNSTFSINGIAITDDYDHEDGVVPYAFANLGLDDLLPKVKRYTITNFIDAPTLDPDNTSDVAVRDYSSNQFYVGPRASSDQYAEFAQNLQDTAFAYSNYVTRDGTFYELMQHMYPGTDFYNAVSGFDNQWYPQHESIDFQNIAVSDVMPIGDNAFIGTISFDYVVNLTDSVRRDTSTYQIFFIKDADGKWKMTNLVIISDDDGDESEAQGSETAAPSASSSADAESAG